MYCPLPDVEPWTVTVPTELSRLHISSLLVKIFSSLRLSQTSVNTFQTLTTQKLSLHCVHVLVHIPQTLRHRHAEHVSQSGACACSSHSPRNLHSHTHTLHVPSAALRFNAAQVKSQASSISQPPCPGLDCPLAAERNRSDVMTRQHEYRAVTLLLQAQTKKGMPKVTAGRRRS